MTKNMTQEEFINSFMNNPNIPLPYKEMVQNNPQRAYAQYLQSVGGVEIPVEDVSRKPQTPSGVVGRYNTPTGKSGGYVSRLGDWLERFRTGTLDFSGGKPTGGAANISNPYLEQANSVSFIPEAMQNEVNKIQGRLDQSRGFLDNLLYTGSGARNRDKYALEELRNRYLKGGN